MTPPLRQAAEELLRAALGAADPEAAVRRCLVREGERLRLLQPEADSAGDRRAVLELPLPRRVVVVGGGKAAPAMARAAEAVLGDRIAAGAVVCSHQRGPRPERVAVLPGSHPLPDARGLQSTAQMVALLDHLGPDDLVLCLISGGGSALMTLPVEGVSLVDLEALNALLLGAGAPIEAVNAVRKHLSRIKGGQLAALARPARVISCILSDVVGSPLSVIASGPTAPDPTTFADALEVLRRFGVEGRTPAAILAHLRRGAAGEIPDTPGETEPVFARVTNLVVGSNEGAAEAARQRAEALGFNARILSTSVQGEAREVGRVLAAVLRELALRENPLPRPACLVVGGETTVTLRGEGKGGRNQELALSAALDLEGLDHVALLALATDGVDGPTDAAGALVDGGTAARARRAGLDPRDHLERNDAYPLLQASGDLLLLGPSGTNVNDITVLLAG